MQQILWLCFFQIEIRHSKRRRKTCNRRSQPGDAVYRAYGDKPVNHKVWDESETMFHFWVVELPKQHLGSDACPIFILKGCSFAMGREIGEGI